MKTIYIMTMMSIMQQSKQLKTTLILTTQKRVLMKISMQKIDIVEI